MHCASCSFDDTKVIDSRLSEEGGAIRRRRSCTQCGYRFTTYERLEGGDVTSNQVGHAVLEQLRLIDEVAYMRFASVYKNFDDAADFKRELALLEKHASTSRA